MPELKLLFLHFVLLRRGFILDGGLSHTLNHMSRGYSIKYYLHASSINRKRIKVLELGIHIELRLRAQPLLPATALLC